MSVFLVSAVLSVSFLCSSLSLLIFLTHLPTSLPLWQRIKQLLWTGLGSVFATYNRRNHIIWMWWSMMIEILVHAVNSFQEIPLPFWFANAQSLHLETSWSVYCGYGFLKINSNLFGISSINVLAKLSSHFLLYFFPSRLRFYRSMNAIFRLLFLVLF